MAVMAHLSNPTDLKEIGEKIEEIEVQIGARFLEHFSEQLYSSPHKAFEELISNAWDAGAQHVYVEVPKALNSPGSALWVLDDGISMDREGLHNLWKVAYSPKSTSQQIKGRPPIGKFGIGKLATYVLANELTYICKSPDGKIRIVTMDYRSIDQSGETDLIRDVKLDLRQSTFDEVKIIVSQYENGPKLLNIIENNFPKISEFTTQMEDEFGGTNPPEPEDTGCWTLVGLTSLKQQGRNVQRGVIKRMIKSSLPLGDAIQIVYNDEVLRSSKINLPRMIDWSIGPELNVKKIWVPTNEYEFDDDHDFNPEESSGVEYEIKSGTDGENYIWIPKVGRVTGRVQVFEDRISGKKSDVYGLSNGFFVNVLGRVVNGEDPAFGEKDLSHSVWARFRMTVRADGLNESLSVNREQFFQNEQIKIFRNFLRKIFNEARKYFDDQARSVFTEPGNAIVNSWGTLPLHPLRDVVPEALENESPYKGLFDAEGISDRAGASEEWIRDAKKDVSQVLSRVAFQEFDPSEGMSRYKIRERALLVNSTHPFIQEHFQTFEEQRTVRNFNLIEFLTDVRALDLGLDPDVLAQVRNYRDRVARLIAKLDRRSGAQIAKLLIEVSGYKRHEAFEIIVSDALEYIGYAVERMAGSGEPEGIAVAYATPGSGNVSQTYKVSFDAKSSKHGKVSTQHVGASALNRHRDAYGADYALVVAPEFYEGSLVEECKSNNVTPMRASDLGRLLRATAAHGAISLTTLREIFELRSPDQVTEKVDQVVKAHENAKTLTFRVFLSAIDALEDNIPEAVGANLLAYHCRQITSKKVTEEEVLRVARGIAVLIPHLLRVEQRDIIIAAHTQKIRQELQAQLASIGYTKADLTISDREGTVGKW